MKVSYCLLATLCVAVSLAALSTQGATWTGAGTGALASNGDNWQGGIAPVANDAIVRDATATDYPMTWDLDIPVASWTQNGYTNVVTIGTRYGTAGLTNLAITGNCSLNDGTWIHLDNASAETYRLRVTVGGDLTVGANAKISATGLGYDIAKGQERRPPSTAALDTAERATAKPSPALLHATAPSPRRSISVPAVKATLKVAAVAFSSTFRER